MIFYMFALSACITYTQQYVPLYMHDYIYLTLLNFTIHKSVYTYEFSDFN